MPGRHALRIALVLPALFGGLGCSDARPRPSAGATEPSAAGSHFDPASAGTVTGRVLWDGAVPDVPPLVGPPGHTARPNPNAPAIGTDGRTVKGAVVFLRGVEPSRARPWDWPPVRVVQQGQQIHVRQGDGDGNVGFVRRGDAVEMVSADATFHSLHAGGAAFFTLAFPDPDRPRARRLSHDGVVELTSAAGYFWMRGYLFVDDRPYFARTDAAGQFALTGVPPGRCEVVCWLPDWREAGHERDPETSNVTRVHFRPPLERAQPLEVRPKGSCAVELRLSAQ